MPWLDIEALFQELGGEVRERAGSRVAVVLFGEVSVVGGERVEGEGAQRNSVAVGIDSWETIYPFVPPQPPWPANFIVGGHPCIADIDRLVVPRSQVLDSQLL